MTKEQENFIADAAALMEQGLSAEHLHVFIDAACGLIYAANAANVANVAKKEAETNV